MGKRARRSPSPAGPLGSRRVKTATAASDGPTAEEEALTATLFGAASSSRTRASGPAERAEQDERETGREAAHDDDLFMLDAAVNDSNEQGAGFTINAAAFDSDAQVDEIEIGDSQDEGSEDYSDDDDNSTSSEDEGTSESSVEEAQGAGPDALPSLSTATARVRKPAWTDPALASLLVPLAGAAARAVDGSLLGTRRLRKLREYEGETQVGGVEYERRLRKMYETIHPRPAWASPQETNQGTTGALSKLLSKSGALVRSKGAKSRIGRLASGSLEVQRARDGNQAIAQDEAAAAVECMAWHPSNRVRLLMTASRDRKLRLFEIDGTSNPLLQTLHVPSLPLAHASFHPSGSSVLLAGPRPYLYSYDLQSGRTTRSTPWRGSSTTSYEAERDLSLARFQGLGGRLLAVGGRRGAVHLLDWGSGAGATGAAGAGAGASIVGSLKLNAALVGMSWDPTRSERLLTLSAQGAVHVWDTRNLTCQTSRSDAGLFGSTALEPSPNADWWAVGSQGGTVNVYDGSIARDQASAEGSMTAKKEIGNLTTRITTMRWNHDGQILALASRNKKDALKLVHAPSLTVFANWPTSGTPLGHVTDVAFSGASEYAAIGNSRGRVLLYSLRHYTGSTA